MKADKNKNSGYIKAKQLNKYLSNLGYSYENFSETINTLVEKECIKTTDLDKDSELQLKATSLGKYHLHSLLTFFQYYDAIIIDTPILDDDFRNEIKDTSNLQERLERAKNFIKYLDQHSASISDKDILAFWEETSKTMKYKIEEIASQQK